MLKTVVFCSMFLFLPGAIWAEESSAVDSYSQEIIQLMESLEDIDINDVGYQRIGFLGEGLWVVEGYVDNVKYEKDTEITEISRKQGVLHNSSQELIVPIEYDLIDVDKDFILLKRDGKNGAANRSGQIIVDVQYDWLMVKNNHIYAYKSNHSSRDVEQLYDSMGHAIIPDGWERVGDYGKDNILLIRDCRNLPEGEKDDFNEGLCGAYQYVDGAGTTAFELDNSILKNYSTFSNGYAAIQHKNGLWGYINITGELVVPFKYQEANPFQSKYALVQSQNGYRRLIDGNDKIFINFKGSDIDVSWKIGADGEAVVIYTIDNVAYDENAEKIP